MAKKPTIDIVIPSFNGKYLLEKHLSQVIDNSDFLNRIIIIDNGSDDGTVEWLIQNHPDIEIVRNKTNLGVTIPINQGVLASSAEFVVLLNNDVSPEKNYLKNILNYFKDKDVFAVSFNEAGSSWPFVSWKDGKFQFVRGEDKSISRFTAWASGGTAIVRRSLWQKIGGINEIYAPYYWEDIDICYRAWKMGYKVIWDKNSHVLHEHESTSKKLNPSYVSFIKQRNELLFTWINITDQNLRSQHLRFLVTHSLKHLGYVRIIILALIHLATNRQKPVFVRTDRQVMSLVNQKYE